MAAPARGLAALTDALKGRLLEALLAADRRAAEAVIDDALSEGMDGLAVLDELLTPVMHAVGRLWESGEITIADEHLATAVAHGMLTRIYPELATAQPRTRGVVLLAGADGEQHMLGLRMVADVLEAAGFDVRNVAGSLPPGSLAAAVRRHRPLLVGLAHTVGGSETLLRSVRAVREVAPETPILLGGAGSTWLQRDGIEVDAHTEVCRSARHALAAAERVTGS